MSAFMVTDAHIDALLTFADRRQLRNRLSEALDQFAKTPLTWSQIGRALLQENARSIHARYGEIPDSDYTHNRYVPFSEMQWDKVCTWILKACQCFDYQACESEDYEQTRAHSVIRLIEAEAIRSLPHYENAPWGID